jgi:hypothetical protein
MKKIFQITFLTAFLISGLNTISAQKALSEALIKYEITDVTSDAMEAQMMKGTEIKIAFNGTFSRLTMQMMGGMVEMDVITEMASEKSTMLMNMMGQKSMVKQDKKEESEDAEVEKKDFDISYDKSDTKEIAGYKCYKATLVDKKTKEKLDMYIAKKLEMPTIKMADDMFPGLKGLPLEISMNAQGMGMTLTCMSLEEKVDKALFDIPEGYTEMTPEEFEKSMGGMGGLGF